MHYCSLHLHCTNAMPISEVYAFLNVAMKIIASTVSWQSNKDVVEKMLWDREEKKGKGYTVVGIITSMITIKFNV